MRRRAGMVAATAAAVLVGGGVAAAGQGCQPLAGPWCGERPATGRLTATGPVRLSGTTASASFEVGDRTIRHLRYADRRELGYTFMLRNDGDEPVTVVDAAPTGPAATLLRVDRLENAGTAATRFTVPADGELAVRLVLDMDSCEHVSSRAGSLVSTVGVRTLDADGTRHDRVVTLPEELHTGSPREGRCPRATSSSRSPG